MNVAALKRANDYIKAHYKGRDAFDKEFDDAIYNATQELTPPPEPSDVKVIHTSWGPGRIYKNQSVTALLPDKPYRYDTNEWGHQTPVFTTQQLEWGNPEDYGFGYNYTVIELHQDQEISCFTSNAHDTSKNSGVEISKKRPPHVYSLRDRFKTTLKQLMGYTGEIPLNVIDLVKSSLPDTDPEKIWRHVRKILKYNGYSQFYNRIPAIIAQLNLYAQRYIASDTFIQILNDFAKLQKQWPIVRVVGHDGKSRITQNIYGRKYFISLRYVALRLMAQYSIEYPYKVPLAIVPKTIGSLDEIYTSMWKRQDELQGLLDLFD